MQRIRPSVVSASKSGAVSPIFIVFARLCTTAKAFASSEGKVKTGVPMVALRVSDQFAELIEIDVTA